MKRSEIRNNIQVLRLQHNLSQQELADKLEITRTYLSKVENQKHLPTEGLMIKICHFFNKQLGEVFYIDKKAN